MPISALFIGLHGLIALILSFIVALERTRTRVWHGSSNSDVAAQPDYLQHPNLWANWVEDYTQKRLLTKSADDGLLQRKVRAHGNFIEQVPLALLLIVTLEEIQAPGWLLWLLGSTLLVARVAHSWGLITTYGPSIGRAIGFFLTSFVYLLGAGACLYYGSLQYF